MDDEKEYTLTVRLGPIHRHKLAAHAKKHRMTLAEVVRCYVNGLPEPEEDVKPRAKRLPTAPPTGAGGGGVGVRAAGTAGE